MKLNRKTRLVLLVLLSIVFVASGIRLIVVQREYAVDKADYDEAIEEFLSFSPEDFLIPIENDPNVTAPGDPEPGEEAPEQGSAGTASSGVSRPAVQYRTDMLVNFEALRAVNPDIVGWIWIPNTAVNYPLLRSDDNNHYLNYNFRNRKSSGGSIFIEQMCAPDLSDLHTIIYGHNMRNKAMFGGLYQYKAISYAEARRSLYIFLESGTYRYDIFSAYTTAVETDTYRVGFSPGVAYEEYLDLIIGQSASLSPNRAITRNDKVVTLSTCTSSSIQTERFVVHAVLEEIILPAGAQAEEPEEPEEPEAPENPEEGQEPPTEPPTEQPTAQPDGEGTQDAATPAGTPENPDDTQSASAPTDPETDAQETGTAE